MPDVEYMKRLAEKFSKGEIPFLGENDKFEFACDQCGKCCRDRSDILLSPLDVFHLSQATGKTGKQILEKYGDCYIGPQSNLPVVRLKYRDDGNGHTTCYFLGQKDGKFYCRVHNHKPTVCRTYPLGKMQTYKKEEDENADFKPKYFLQEDDPSGECAGLRRSRRDHIEQTVVDWVGGKEKMEVADKYSEIFYRFTSEYGKELKLEKIKKKAFPVVLEMFFGMLGKMIYSDYDDCLTDEQFLSKLEFNLGMALVLVKKTSENPNYILDVLGIEHSQCKDDAV
jgi:Fe-S-cluster containining protein